MTYVFFNIFRCISQTKKTNFVEIKSRKNLKILSRDAMAGAV